MRRVYNHRRVTAGRKEARFNSDRRYNQSKRNDYYGSHSRW